MRSVKQEAEVHGHTAKQSAYERTKRAKTGSIGRCVLQRARYEDPVTTQRGTGAEAGGRTQALALTAYARAPDAQRAFAAGYQRHVPKPVEPAELVSVVANLGGKILDEG